MEDKIINISNQKYLPLICDSVPEVFRLKAEKEIHETEENIKNGLAILRDCIKRKQLQVNNDANFLLPYLRQAKFDPNKVIKKLIHSTKIFEKWEGDIASCDLKRIQAVIDNKFVGLLPVRDREGRAVVFTRGTAWKKDLYDISDATVAMLCLLMFASTFPLTSVCGITYLADSKLPALDYITDALAMFNGIRKLLPCLPAYSFRIQRCDVVNSDRFCRYLYKGLRPLLPSKLRDRVFIHGSNFEEFYKTHPPSVLPLEFGGTAGPINPGVFRDKFMEYMRNKQDQLKNKTIK